MTKLAIIQEPPVYLDLEKTMSRAVELIAKAAGEGAQMVVFPEAWFPGYPTFVWRLPPGAGMGKTDELFPNKDEWVNPGDAVIYKPFGGIHAGPMHKEKGMLLAEIDVSAARSSRRKFDVSGHYARPDVFSLCVNRAEQPPVTFE